MDELNAALGMARASGANAEWIPLINALQEKLIGLMGQLATLPEDEARCREKGFPLIGETDVEWVLAEARKYEGQGIRFNGWARPGAEGCLARASVDFARSVDRRAERTILRLHESGKPVPETVRLFFNKLADLLWILARVESECRATDGIPTMSICRCGVLDRRVYSDVWMEKTVSARCPALPMPPR